MTAATESTIREAVSTAMDDIVEKVVESYKKEIQELSDYEIERNKPKPNFIHGALQTRISSFLHVNYGEKYIFPNELSLATKPVGSTPDICIYPFRKLKFEEVEAKESEPPITTIEIQSPSQTNEELQNKVRSIYFPMGVRSAWIVFPSLRTVQIMFPNGKSSFFNSGKLTDPTTGIELDLDKIFAILE